MVSLSVLFHLRSPSPMSSTSSEETLQPPSRGGTTSPSSHPSCGDCDDSSGIDDADSDTDGHCDVIWGKSGGVPSNLSVSKVPKPDQAATSARAKKKKGPKPGEHVQLFRMQRDRNKGFYSEKCYLEASIACCFE